MNYLLKFACMLPLLMWCLTGKAAGLGQLPQFDDLGLSADGSQLLLVRAVGDVYDVVVRDLDSGIERNLFSAGREKGLELVPLG